MTLRRRAQLTVVAGSAVAAYGLVELPFAVRTPTLPASLLLVFPVAAFYTLLVAAPGERIGFGTTRPLRRLPRWAKAVWALLLLAPFASLLVWPPSNDRHAPAAVGFPSLLAVYFGVILALMSWERLRGISQPAGSLP